jgi:serine-type D-Ala-D-Ala carboxypeptidase (penicillin-binding protein 5/6)
MQAGPPTCHAMGAFMRLTPRFTVPAAACVLACTLAALVPAQQASATAAAHGSAVAAAGRRPAAATRLAKPADITAGAAELINAVSGRTLWSRELNRQRPIASITKVMTAIVVIKSLDLKRKIRVTQAAVTYAADNDATTAGLVPGDLLTARQLLEGLLLPSGADAAYLLANSYGPGWRAFVRKMNSTARRLGMTRTHFANFDGLPWPTEYSTYSTPHDLMIMAAAAMKLSVFRAIVRQHHDLVVATGEHHRYYWTNTDLLIGRYRGAVGIKTGFTLGAGYCLLFEAVRGKKELAGVVLDSTRTNPSVRFTAATRLLNWGFRDLSG